MCDGLKCTVNNLERGFLNESEVLVFLKDGSTRSESDNALLQAEIGRVLRELIRYCSFTSSEPPCDSGEEFTPARTTNSGGMPTPVKSS